MRSQSNIVYTQNQPIIENERGGASVVMVQNGQRTIQQIQPLRQSTLEQLPPRPHSILEKFQQMQQHNQEKSRLHHPQQHQNPYQMTPTAQLPVPCILSSSVQSYGHLTSSGEPSTSGKTHNGGYGAMSSQCKGFVSQPTQTTNYKSSGVNYSNPTTYSTLIPALQTTNYNYSNPVATSGAYSNPVPLYPVRQLGYARPYAGYNPLNRQNQPNPPQILLARSNPPQPPPCRQIPFGKQPVQPLVSRPTQNQSFEKNQTTEVKKYSKKRTVPSVHQSASMSLQNPPNSQKVQRRQSKRARVDDEQNLIQMALLDAGILESEVEIPVEKRSKIDKKTGKIPDLVENIGGFEIRVIRANHEAWRVFPDVV